MSPRPTTERPLPAGDAAIDAGEHEFDAVLGVYTIFLVVPRVEVVYSRLVVESWEDFAVPRTVQRFWQGDPGRGLAGDDRFSLVVVLAVPDFIQPCARGLERICREIGGFQVPSTPGLCEALRRDLLDPEASGGPSD
ncbi:MAG: hypothetical protein ABR538_15280 [Candidatus Binatia bacterium]